LRGRCACVRKTESGLRWRHLLEQGTLAGLDGGRVPAGLVDDLEDLDIAEASTERLQGG
jgi:hypothetical protein